MQQFTYDPDDYGGNKQAIAARNKRAKELRKQGHRVLCDTLRNQERGYSGFGTARDHSRRNVYMLSILD